MSTVERTRHDPESAADYPTPPSYERKDAHVRIEVDGVVIAETRRPVIVRQTGIAPVFYIPREDVRTEYLLPSDRTSHCPYKGDATYFTLDVRERRIGNAAWAYEDSLPEAESIVGHVAFYAHLVDATVDGEPARAPDWKWVGGWVLPWTTGPFKGRDTSQAAE
jgi:uncharacterized protein (DUF427 family)